MYLSLYLSFLQVGLLAFGGGYASMPLIQAQVVDYHHWLTTSQLVDIFALSQLTPGPIGINAATFIGMQEAGIGGAIVATAGFVTPSVIFMVLMAKLLVRYGELEMVKNFLEGLRWAVIGLIGVSACTFFVIILWESSHQTENVVAFNGGSLALFFISLYLVRYRKMAIMKNLLLLGCLGFIFGNLGLL